MKVLSLVHSYPPGPVGGAELALHELLLAIADRGHEVVVAKPSAGECDSLASGCHPRAGASISVCAGVPPFPTSEVDFVLTQVNAYRWAHAYCDRHRLPLVNYAHSEAQLGRRADIVIANSQWLHARVRRDRISALMRPLVRIDDYSVEPFGDHVTFVNPTAMKGVGLVRELVRRLPELPFLIVEGGWGEQERVGGPNVCHRRHRSAVEAMRDVYRRTRVLLVPSLYESWGRCAVEAACSGIPVVCTATRGLCESMADTAIFVKRTAVGELREAVLAAYEDRFLRDACARRGRTRARELERLAVNDRDTVVNLLERYSRSRTSRKRQNSRPKRRPRPNHSPPSAGASSSRTGQPA